MQPLPTMTRVGVAAGAPVFESTATGSSELLVVVSSEEVVGSAMITMAAVADSGGFSPSTTT